MKWDISEMDSWTYEQFPPGAVIPEAGNAIAYITGGWRSERPVRDSDACTQCMLCWIVCPDASVTVIDEEVGAFDLDHCKGCGICANVCPAHAITMVPEGCSLPEVK